MPAVGEHAEAETRPGQATPLAYFDRGDASWLPVYKGVVWGAVCYFGLSIMGYLVQVAQYNELFPYSSGFSNGYFRARLVARSVGEVAKLVFVVAAISSFGMRQRSRRFLTVAATVVLIVAPLSDFAGNTVSLLMAGPWTMRGGGWIYLLNWGFSAMLVALVPLLLVIFLRRSEVRILFR